MGCGLAGLRDPPATLGPVLDFMRVLWAVDHGLLQVSRRMERTLGVTGPQRLVLRIVGRHPGISAGALARTLHVHPGTLTGVLRRLARRGLLERVADPRDGRRSMLRLTSAGAGANERRGGTAEDRIRSALRTVPPPELECVRRVLSAVAEELGRREPPAALAAPSARPVGRRASSGRREAGSAARSRKSS